MVVETVYVKFSEVSEWLVYDILDTQDMTVYNCEYGSCYSYNYVADAYDVRFIKPDDVHQL